MSGNLQTLLAVSIGGWWRRLFRLSSRPSHILVKAGEAGGEIYVVWHSWKMGVWALRTGNEVYRRSSVLCGESESSEAVYRIIPG